MKLAPPCGAMLAMALWAGAASATGEACPVQPRPAALDSVRPPATSHINMLVSFSATPSLQYPRESWVVRVYSEIVFDEDRVRDVVEVIRLQGEYDCNRWFNTGLWEGELETGEVSRTYEAVVPFLQPAAAALDDGDSYASENSLIIVDGTGIAVETGGADWRLRRDGHAHDRSGQVVSALFRALAAGVVPAEEMPEQDWSRAR